MSNREYDIILFGSTSFVGKIVANYLVNEHVEANLNWAMAARSMEKLSALKASFGEKGQNVPLIEADSSDEESLKSMCGRAGVIISTVGPYALYGELLIKQCALSGTDYVDLTGEPQWIKRMIAGYENDAKASGARIIHSCGFDSIPSDLGVMFLQGHALASFGSACKQVKMRVKAMQGGASGGTIASGVNLYKEAAADPALRKEMRDFYSLCPTGHQFTERQANISVEYDEDFKAWVGPFIMASINTRIVLRSNALRDGFYTDNFRYDEGMLMGNGPKGKSRAKRLAFGSKFGGLVMSISLFRWFVNKFFLLKPGEGPSPEKQLRGFYDLRFLGRTDKGDEIRVKVTGDRDPGYGSTAKMLAQAAISLRRDVDKNLVAGGFWTPATAFNHKLIERLQDYAGMSFEVESDVPPAVLEAQESEIDSSANSRN